MFKCVKERQTEREAGRQTGIQMYRHADRETEGQKNRQTEDIQTEDIQTEDIQTYRQKTYRQKTYRQIDSRKPQMHRLADSLMDRQKCI